MQGQAGTFRAPFSIDPGRAHGRMRALKAAVWIVRRLQFGELGGGTAGRARTTLSNPRVGAVVCTRDRVDDLARCLESLERQHFRDRETVVIDKGGARRCAISPAIMT